MIDTCAYAYGGIHSGKPRPKQSSPELLELDQELLIDGQKASISAMPGIIRTVLRGLEPLRNAVKTRPE